MTALEQLGKHVAAGGRGGGDGRLRETLALHLTDTLGAWLAGRSTSEGEALVALRSGPHSNDGLGEGAGLVALRSGAHSNDGDGLAERVALHCALARLSEIDDIHLASATTPGGVIVPAALTVAGALGSPGPALAEAIAVGYEAMVRLGVALDGPSILYRGIWPTYFAAPFGVAAAAARLFSLSETQAAHALGIALLRAAPGVGHQTGTTISRWWALGRAAGEGVRAALAAQAGFTADLSVLEGEFFPSLYALTPDIGALTADLGATSVLPAVSFKPWCAARQTMAAAQALVELAQEGVSPADAVEITAFVPRPYWKMVNHGIVPGDRASCLTSLPYQLALAALEPETRFDVQQSPGTISGRCAAFMEKVKVMADDGLLAHYPRAWPARLVVKTSAGTREKLVLHVPGDPERPFGGPEVLVKLRRFLVPLSGQSAVLDLAERSSGMFGGDPSAAEVLSALERVTGHATS